MSLSQSISFGYLTLMVRNDCVTVKTNGGRITIETEEEEEEEVLVASVHEQDGDSEAGIETPPDSEEDMVDRRAYYSSGSETE